MATQKKGEGQTMSTTGGRSMQRPPRLMDPLSDVERLFDELLPTGFMRPARFERPAWMDVLGQSEMRMPRVDIVDRDKDIMVRAEIPGVRKEDLDISVTDDTVTIKATTQHSEETGEHEGNYYRCEISRGAFARTLSLPVQVDGNKAEATFKDGMLEITLPKMQASERRRITIK